MTFEKFLEPKEVEIDGRGYVISQIPAVPAIPIQAEIAKVIADNGILGIAMLPPSVVRAVLAYTAVIDEDGDRIVPDTERLVNDLFSAHKGDMSIIVAKMMKENFGFLTNGDLLKELAEQAEATESVS